MGEAIVPVVGMIVGLIIVLAVVLFPVWLVLAIVWLCRGGRCRVDSQKQRQEAELMQQIHQGLSRLEQRVESLETILLDSNAPGAERLSSAGKEL